MLSGLKILITGASGFIGSNLVRRLICENVHVGIVALPSDSLENVADSIGKIDVLKKVDIESITEFMNVFKPDLVIHLASIFISEHKPSDINSLVNSNILFGTVILEAMKQAKVKKLINTGTSWQYFQGMEYNPVNLYAATKEAYESLCRYYFEVENYSMVHLKLYDTYGPNDKRKKLFNILLEAYRTNQELSMSAGEQLINIVHVKDVIQAYLQAITLLHGEKNKMFSSFAVSTKENIKLKDLVNLYLKTKNRVIKINWGMRPYRIREVFSPSFPFPNVPNWEPKIELKDGLKDLD